MARFRKKPVEVEAHQWWKNGDHPLDYTEKHDGQQSPEYRKRENWEGEVVRYFRRPDVPGDKVCAYCGNTMHDHGWIDTFEGGHIVCPSDWIITGVKGEMYPCKVAIFDATYDRV
jgi:hypothetical protein